MKEERKAARAAHVSKNKCTHAESEWVERTVSSILLDGLSQFTRPPLSTDLLFFQFIKRSLLLQSLSFLCFILLFLILCLDLFVRFLFRVHTHANRNGTSAADGQKNSWLAPCHTVASSSYSLLSSAQAHRRRNSHKLSAWNLNTSSVALDKMALLLRPLYPGAFLLLFVFFFISSPPLSCSSFKPSQNHS